MVERNTRIRASQIQSILPDDLEATNSLTDNYVPSYDLASGKFTWVAAGTIPDRIEENIMLNAFRIAINGSLVKYNMVDGIMDEFEDESGVDTGTSTNEDYDSTNDYYSPTFLEATGGIITYDGNYVIHTFIGDGTFTPPNSLDVEYLVVAGGAGGGGSRGGAGGAGGFRTASGFAVTAQGYSIIVGASGAGASSNAKGGSGGDSVFSTITSIGGGGGASSGVPGGNNGGSGGGGVPDGGTFGSGEIGQGNNGGSGVSPVNPNYGAGGGGGANTVGADGTTTNGGNGGNGIASSISGFSATYAAGGGGGIGTGGTGGNGGSGIGGNGGVTGSSAGTDGTSNTGSGGGGGGSNNGGSGGSGIVIIKYLLADLTQLANMTLVSNSTEAEVQPDESRVVIFEEDVDAITLNTDLKAYCSRDNGANWVQATLSDEGDYESSKRILVGTADISGQAADKTMKWKLETLNAKALKIHGIGELWG